MRRLIFYSLVILIISACVLNRDKFMNNSTPTEVPHTFLEIWEGGFRSGIPCAPSCILGITPGITTEEEAIDLLQKHDVSEWCETYDYEFQGGGRGVDCGDFFSFDYRPDSEVIESVVITPLGPYIMEEVIATYGSPEFVDVYLISLPEYPPKIQMTIYYPTFLGMMLLPEQEGVDYLVETDTPIEAVFLYEKSYFQEVHSSAVQDWHGYGKYPYTW
jgi:hypothetical protein